MKGKHDSPAQTDSTERAQQPDQNKQNSPPRPWLAAGRFLLLIGVILVALLICLPLRACSWPVRHAVARQFCRLALAVLGVRVYPSGAALAKRCLLAGNHIAVLDGLVLGAYARGLFLVKAELARWPVIGWLLAAGGIVPLERGHGAASALEKMTNILRSGQRVILFPEATTSNGRRVRRFQPRLFQAAINADCPVQGFCLTYQTAAGEPADWVAYIGPVSVIGSLWQVAAHPRLHARLRLAEPAQGADRQALAQAAENWVRSVLAPGSAPLRRIKPESA